MHHWKIAKGSEKLCQKKESTSTLFIIYITADKFELVVKDWYKMDYSSDSNSAATKYWSSKNAKGKRRRSEESTELTPYKESHRSRSRRRERSSEQEERRSESFSARNSESDSRVARANKQRLKPTQTDFPTFVFIRLNGPVENKDSKCLADDIGAMLRMATRRFYVPLSEQDNMAAVKGDHKATLNIQEQHISLGRNLFLKYHLSDAFKEDIRRCVVDWGKSLKPVIMNRDGEQEVSIYLRDQVDLFSNASHDKHFAALSLDSFSAKNIRKLQERVDNVIRNYCSATQDQISSKSYTAAVDHLEGQEKRPHVSIAYTDRQMHPDVKRGEQLGKHCWPGALGSLEERPKGFKVSHVCVRIGERVHKIAISDGHITEQRPNNLDSASD